MTKNNETLNITICEKCRKNLPDKNWIFNLLKNHKKTGEGFGDCIGSFWDDGSVMELAGIIAKRIGAEK